jgi:hypothetical protein
VHRYLRPEARVHLLTERRGALVDCLVTGAD